RDGLGPARQHERLAHEAAAHRERMVQHDVLDARIADAAAVDRPELYDLDTLRARFAPEQVRTVE
ncbi:MAG: hypothetical protein ACKOEP_11155, partial [Phycisphaerales bacterium]